MPSQTDQAISDFFRLSGIEDQDLFEAKNIDLSLYGLQGLVDGKPTTLFHGTTSSFKEFDVAKSRKELVDAYYGSGIFLTPSKKVAESYAEANRNIGFDPSVIDQIAKLNRNAGEFVRKLAKNGDSTWDDYTPETMGVKPEDFAGSLGKFFGGMDPNSLADIAALVIGSKLQRVVNTSSDPVNIFSMSTGLPSYAYDMLDEIGVDSSIYRPKVYTVEVTVDKPLVTANKNAAKNAQKKGYDSVVYYGPGIVSSTPEVAVFDPRKVRIKKVEVV
jgi:hypothetical protein